MPLQESAWANQQPEPLEMDGMDFPGLGGQSPTLVISEAGLFAQLLFEDLDLCLEVIDHVLLVTVDPTGQANEQQL
jgi:hypothetical protein